MTTLLADSAEVADYAVDFAAALASGETITGQTVTVPSGLTLGSGAKAPAASGTKVVFWISGGVAVNRYDLEVTATTSGGRTFVDRPRFWVMGGPSGDTSPDNGIIDGGTP